MGNDLPCITDVDDIKGKKVLLRASLNVPITKDGVLLDAFRLEKAFKTINYLKTKGAKVIIIGHLGRDSNVSLEPVFSYFKKNADVNFVHDIVGDMAKKAVSEMKDGDILLLENVRQDDGEKENSLHFAESLASLGDIYVNDCFSASHRDHASIVSIPQFLPSFIGILFKEELDNLEYARNPKHPALFILGGAKFATKQPLVEKFLEIYDHVFVTGALANDFFKAQGYNVGRSIVSEPAVNVDNLLNNKKIILPIDVVVLNESGESFAKKPDELDDGDMINDSGPETIRMLAPIIKDAKFVLWNGPTGDYQLGFIEGTKELVSLIADSDTESVVGGGDTMSLITKFGLDKAFTFGSTAGGAMLAFLLDGTLPGIEAIKNSKNN